ncbi:SRPBCC family protein [Massilia sp. CCM 9210]|uniref:SRPBCC family protein n=1 Tax=Massilia scottii TaxID=3057166 RepID=UPI002796C941|nr:SRPBCC family protein [Massilia sp. CCM 9210]MDQ1813877.1 SRPBCC family protein [Massilia sp. CCM 9210]
MAHERIAFPMPASCEVVFDVFHYHQWRARWDSLVSHTEVDGGAPCPYVGAVSENVGGGLLRALSMRTEFVSYQRPRLAAARMLGTSFPFSKWAASMKHESAAGGGSVLIYTYNIEAGPRMLRWLIEPVVHHVFRRQTVKRFERMRAFLATNASEVEAWQRACHGAGSTGAQ